MIHTTQPVISDDFQHFSKKGLHFIHLNIRSLLPKLDELILLATKTNAAVIGITESWLDDKSKSVDTRFSATTVTDTGVVYAYTYVVTFRFLPVLSINEGHCLNECILLGDFNTDILLPTNNVLVNALRNFEHAFGIKQLIVEPTRVCINTASAIDLILVSDPEKVCQSGVICVGISDHQA